MRCMIFLILTFIAPLSANPKLIIGIAGGTGSGKTTLAEKLINTFGSRAVLIKQDDYYKGLAHLTLEERSLQNFDHPDSIDFELLRQHLCQLKAGCPIEVPVYNFCYYDREASTSKVLPADIIIVEGILLFAVPEIRDLCDVKIFVDTDHDVRLLRRIERDMNERGRSLSSVRNQYLKTVKPMHDAFVEPSKRFADVIIPTMKHNENGVALIISAVRKDLDNSLICEP